MFVQEIIELEQNFNRWLFYFFFFSSKKSEIKCLALNDYIALYSKNLSLKKGEKYTLLSRENDSWYLVKDKHGNKGYAPSNYLEVNEPEKELASKLDKSHYGKE